MCWFEIKLSLKSSIDEWAKTKKFMKIIESFGEWMNAALISVLTMKLCKWEEKGGREDGWHQTWVLQNSMLTSPCHIYIL